MDYLKSQNVGFPRFVYGVAFPETVFSSKSISYAPEQIFDANNNNDFYTNLTKLKNYYGERDRSKDFRPPNKQEMANIRRILGPNYEAVAPLRHLVVLRTERLYAQYIRAGDNQICQSRLKFIGQIAFFAH